MRTVKRKNIDTNIQLGFPIQRKVEKKIVLFVQICYCRYNQFYPAKTMNNKFESPAAANNKDCAIYAS